MLAPGIGAGHGQPECRHHGSIVSTDIRHVTVLGGLAAVSGQGLRPDVRALVDASVAEATRRAYAADWARFAVWCVQVGADPWMPGEHMVSMYLAEAAGLVNDQGAPAIAAATMRRWVSGINQIHAAAGAQVPGRSELVRRTLAGVRKSRQLPQRRRRPLRLAEIARIVTAMAARLQPGDWPGGIRARRDRLILVAGHLGAFREAELVALRVGDVEHVSGGLQATVRSSKTDQLAEGTTKGLRATTAASACPLCAWVGWRAIIDAHDSGGRVAVLRELRVRPDMPVSSHICGDDVAAPPLPARPLLRWLGRSGWPTDRGLSPHAVYHVVKARAAQAGIPLSIVAALGGHSLRAGFVTDAFAAGASDGEVMRQTAHRSVAQVRSYQRDIPLAGNAVTRIDE